MVQRVTIIPFGEIDEAVRDVCRRHAELCFLGYELAGGRTMTGKEEESHRPSVWSRWDARDDTCPGDERFGEHRGGHGDRPDGCGLGRSKFPQRCLSGCGYDKDISRRSVIRFTLSWPTETHNWCDGVVVDDIKIVHYKHVM